MIFPDIRIADNTTIAKTAAKARAKVLLIAPNIRVEREYSMIMTFN